jgi:hypothetical protein
MPKISEFFLLILVSRQSGSKKTWNRSQNDLFIFSTEREDSKVTPLPAPPYFYITLCD